MNSSIIILKEQNKVSGPRHEMEPLLDYNPHFNTKGFAVLSSVLIKVLFTCK
jgi:hypothetical protein